MARVSIIVPVYNAQETLERCIESILSQTYEGFELILVDDGSTDGSTAIVEAYARKDARVRAVHTENKGVSSARNTGLDLAQGDYIGFADADDWIDADMYARLLGLIERERADIAICGYYTEQISGQDVPAFAAPFLSQRVLSAKQAYSAALAPDGFQGFLWNKLFHASFFARDGRHIRLDESLHICEDLLCSCICLCQAEKIVWESAPLYHYAVSENSASHNGFSMRKATLLDARRQISELTRKYFPGLVRQAESSYVTDAVFIFILAMHSGSGTDSFKGHSKHIRRNIAHYLFDKSASFKYKCLALLLCISPRMAQALWRLLRRG